MSGKQAWLTLIITILVTAGCSNLYEGKRTILGDIRVQVQKDSEYACARFTRWVPEKQEYVSGSLEIVGSKSPATAIGDAVGNAYLAGVASGGNDVQMPGDSRCMPPPPPTTAIQ